MTNLIYKCGDGTVVRTLAEANEKRSQGIEVATAYEAVEPSKSDNISKSERRRLAIQTV